MKKIMSVVLALALCLSLASFAAAEGEIPVEEITVELDETYVETALGENYCFTYLPADWVAMEVEFTDETSELLGAFASADGTQMLVAVYIQTEIESSYEQVYTQAVDNGLSAGLMNINGYEYVCIATATEEQVVMIATFFTDETGTEAVTFTYTAPLANAADAEALLNQVLGGFDFYEAEEAAE